MTAAGPLGAQWPPTRPAAAPPPAARAPFPSLPGVSGLATRLTVAPTLLASRLSGHTPGLMRYPFRGPSSVLAVIAARTAVFDRAGADAPPGVRRAPPGPPVRRDAWARLRRVTPLGDPADPFGGPVLATAPPPLTQP